MNKKAILFAGVCISLLFSACKNKNDKDTTDKASTVELSTTGEVTTTEVETTVEETVTEVLTETESITDVETENIELSDIIDLEKERDDLEEYAESFITNYVECIKDDQYDRETLFGEMNNEKLKKYVEYTIDNKSCVVLNIPNEKTKCFFEDTNIELINETTACYESNINFSDNIDYESSYASAGYVYVIISRTESRNIVGDFYWYTLDSPDELYRLEYKPHDNYIDFWNDEQKANEFLNKLGIS